MGKKTIGIFVGSLRKGAFTKMTANYISSQLSSQYTVEFIQMDQLCYYNQDFDDENRVPAEWTAFRKKVLSLDALLFVTPEYNRSFPALIKNALDIASRGVNCWDKKPAAIVALSPGHIGGAIGARALRAPLAFLNVKLMMQPEVYLSGASTLFDEAGNLTNESTAGFLNKFCAAFSAWVEAEA